MLTQTTKMITPAEAKGDWWVIDAEGAIVGRLAAQVARLLKGTHKPSYTPHILCGDHVVIINADKVRLTGNKFTAKEYHRHTGYIGGIKTRTPKTILASSRPGEVIRLAVDRMLKKGIMKRRQLTRLMIYAGTDHPHAGQNPKVLDLAAQNPKNKRNA